MFSYVYIKWKFYLFNNMINTLILKNTNFVVFGQIKIAWYDQMEWLNNKYIQWTNSKCWYQWLICIFQHVHSCFTLQILPNSKLLKNFVTFGYGVVFDFDFYVFTDPVDDQVQIFLLLI